MRAITGALLIVAAAVCFLAGVIARGQDVVSRQLDVVQLAYVLAAALCLAGLVFLSRGFAEAHTRARTDLRHEQMVRH